MNELMREILFLPEQASTVAPEIDHLHYFVITVTVLGTAAVALTSAILLHRFRRGSSRRRTVTREGRGVPRLEIIGSVGLFALFVLWWVVGFRQYVRVRTMPEGAQEVYVVAKQWMWAFAYADGSGSNETLYVPEQTPIKLVLTSRDVIHSFYVPAFRIKQDVVPGRMTTAWFEARRPGRYPIYCAEYCGAGHSDMRGEIVVLSAVDYARHRQGLAPVAEHPTTLAEQGERVAAEHGCFRCHTADGTPHIGPTWAGVYGTTVATDHGPRVVDEAYLTDSMMDPLAAVRSGFLPAMPTYQGQLGAADVGALVEYIRSLASVSPEPGREPMPRGLLPATPIQEPTQ